VHVRRSVLSSSVEVEGLGARWEGVVVEVPLNRENALNQGECRPLGRQEGAGGEERCKIPSLEERPRTYSPKDSQHF